MINDRGGINGRKINLISYDDAGNAAEDGRAGPQAH
jgi:ABC-type branched-subunit amino acid transport system substrate-binding protein